MAVLDILTAAEAGKVALNTDSTAQAGEIQTVNTAISARIDELVGPVVQRTVTEYHDGCMMSVWPRQTPLASVTTLKHADGSTVTTYTQDAWGTTGNTDGFLVEQSGSYAHDVRIFRRSGGSTVRWPSGHRSIEIVYVAGRAATTAAVPAKFKLCAETIIRRVWDREAGVWARGADPFQENAGGSRFFKAIDPMVAEFLADEMKPPSVA